MEEKRLIIVAVGGQGNLFASNVLCQAALLANLPVRMSEIHGMAQRGGIVESAIVFGDVQSSLISDGKADILLGFEPSETLRALNKANPNTIVITNTAPMPPFTANIGIGTYPSLVTIIKLLSEKSKKLITIDATSLAKQAENPLAVNMVLLGALIQTQILPITPEQTKEAIRLKSKKGFEEKNITAFELGYAAAAA